MFDKYFSEIIRHLDKIENRSRFGIMVDIETLSLSPNAVSINLAAKVFSFDPTGIDIIPELFYGKKTVKELTADDCHSINIRLSTTEQIFMGRAVDQPTINWWANTDRLEEARKEILEIPVMRFKEGMAKFKEFIDYYQGFYNCPMYFRGIDFDYPILTSLFKDAGVDYKWNTKKTPRDVRTTIDAFTGLNLGYIPGFLDIDSVDIKPQTQHTALGDVERDIEQMQIAYAFATRDKVINEDDDNNDLVN